MLQRRKQIRTQAPFLLADRIQVAALQQQSKKALREIFRLFRPDALPSYEAIDRSPIRCAEFFKGCLRCGRWTLRLKYYAPVRGTKRHRTMRGVSANRAQ